MLKLHGFIKKKSLFCTHSWKQFNFYWCLKTSQWIFLAEWNSQAYSHTIRSIFFNIIRSSLKIPPLTITFAQRFQNVSRIITPTHELWDKRLKHSCCVFFLCLFIQILIDEKPLCGPLIIHKNLKQINR